MYKLKNVFYILIILVSIFMFDSLVFAYKSYSIGDSVTYNDIEFYVIKDSSSEEDTLTLLKAEPLTVDEVNLYGGVGTDDNHVNKYTIDSVGTAYDIDGYGGMAYYSSETCKSGTYDGCIIEYNQSDIKYVLDAWANDKVPNGLQDVRLIKYGELIDELGFILKDSGTGYEPSLTKTPSWVYDVDYHYWTMSAYNDRYVYRWTLGGGDCGGNSAGLCAVITFENKYLVRPVVTLNKSVIEKEETIIDDDTDKENDKTINNDTKEIVNVPNTLQRISIISIMIGVILISISIVIVLKNRK